MSSSLQFRWLGVQGVELSLGGKILLIDPFLSRPPLWNILWGRPQSNSQMISEKIQRCDYIFLTHTHWDHFMDVPELVKRSGAIVFGSPNAGTLLDIHNINREKFQLIHPGDKTMLNGFQVEVFESPHTWIPAGSTFSGLIHPGLRVPLRLRDYRMDFSYGFFIQADNLRLLINPGRHYEADVLFISTQRSPAFYPPLLSAVQPRWLIPVHWDNFFLPIETPLVELKQPFGMSLKRLKRILETYSPTTRWFVPEIFQRYTITDIL